MHVNTNKARDMPKHGAYCYNIFWEFRHVDTIC